MAINLHEAITTEQIQDINEQVRFLSFSTEERQQIADEVGVSISTVNRWFTQGNDRINMVPTSLAGVIPAMAMQELEIDESRSFRLAMGIMLLNNNQTDTLTGEQYEEQGTRASLVGLVNEFRDILQDGFFSQSIRNFRWDRLSGVYSWRFVYSTPLAGQSPKGLRSLLGIGDNLLDWREETE